MKKYLFLFYILIIGNCIAQKTVTLKNVEKRIEFINFFSEENMKNYGTEPHFLYTPFDNILEFKIPLYTKVGEDFQVFPLSELNEKFKRVDVLEHGDIRDTIYYEPDIFDFPIVGVEKSKGFYKKELIETTDYVHFYTETWGYAFSIKFYDFRSYLKYKNQLYVDLEEDFFWKNYIPITKPFYCSEYKHFHENLINKVIKDTSIHVFDDWENKRIKNIEVNELLKPRVQNILIPDYISSKFHNSFGGQIYLKDRIENGKYYIDSIGYEIYNDPFLWGLNKRYILKLDSTLVKVHDKDSIYVVEDAVALGLLKTDSIKYLPKTKKSSSVLYKALAQKGKFSVIYTEAIILSAPENKTIWTKYPNFLEQIIELANNKELIPYGAYFSEEYKFILEFDNLKKRLEQESQYSEFSTKTNYHKGDTVVHYRKSYVAKKDIFGYNERKISTNDTRVQETVSNNFIPFNENDWGKSEPVYYHFSELTDVELNFEMTFDEKGENVSMELKTIDFFVPATAEGNTHGYQYPIATFEWKELKKYFKDKEFIDFLEKRKYFSYYIKSDYLKKVE